MAYDALWFGKNAHRLLCVLEKYINIQLANVSVTHHTGTQHTQATSVTESFLTTNFFDDNVSLQCKKKVGSSLDARLS